MIDIFYDIGVSTLPVKLTQCLGLVYKAGRSLVRRDEFSLCVVIIREFIVIKRNKRRA